MTAPNPVFEKNYGDYLKQLDSTYMSRWEAVLDITVNEQKRTAQIPFMPATGGLFSGCRMPGDGRLVPAGAFETG